MPASPATTSPVNTDDEPLERFRALHAPTGELLISPSRLGCPVGAGAVAVNLEDGSAPPALLADKLCAVRARLGDGVFVHARTRVVLHRRVEPARIVDEVLAVGVRPGDRV